MRNVLIGVVFGSVALQGCGPTCQTACHRLYAPEVCDIRVPGVPEWTDMYDTCMDECEVALTKPGELGDYDPDQRPTGGESVHLENERQAGAWMLCVEETDCGRLNEGYCPPS
jgi:hypothetical protein